MGAESLNGQTRKAEHTEEPWYQRAIETIQDTLETIRFEIGAAFSYIDEYLHQPKSRDTHDQS
ncbi:MAG TPA: hypothetical protein VI873_00210 [Candidatus Peribacteraceae bacterium]|nr:hypothetical protein [Candidatus Peribacteraceae bacterium]